MEKIKTTEREEEEEEKKKNNNKQQQQKDGRWEGNRSSTGLADI